MAKDLFGNEIPAEDVQAETVEAVAEKSDIKPEDQTQGSPTQEPAPKKKAAKIKGAAKPECEDGISLTEAIYRIGLELKCPKSNTQKDSNTGRSFPYRTVEDILTALIPFREKYGVFLTFTSRPVLVGTFNYIVVEATIHNLRGESFTTCSSAREDAERPGYWGAQISGSCESYAKKYALQSMFMIDEGKVGAVTDTDATPAPSSGDTGRAASGKAHGKMPSVDGGKAGEPAPATSDTPKVMTARPRLIKGQGDWMARLADAATWPGTENEFKNKILDNYLITKADMAELLRAFVKAA